MKRVFLMMVGLAGFSLGAEVVPVEKAEKLLGEKVQILDVRTKKEWDEGCLVGAIKVDIRSKSFEEEVKKQVDPTKPLLVYCHSGGRSARAAAQLEKLGFEKVYDLEGGITAWKKAEKEVVK